MFENMSQIVAAVITLSGLGAAFGFFLSLANKKLFVKQDPRFEKVLACLPGTNCGACGFPGCAGYADRIVVEGVAVNLCPVGGENSAKPISEIMGVESGSAVKKIARVHCKGGIAETRNKFRYLGHKSCLAAEQVSGGFKICSYGCLGFGDCVVVCPFDAISLNENGLPVVNEDKCTGCGKCTKACPRSIISLQAKGHKVYVQCRNKERAAVMKEGCSVGCIGCQLCVIKACKLVFQENPNVESAMKVADSLAAIDYSVCIDCGKCSEVCPQKVISYQVKS